MDRVSLALNFTYSMERFATAIYRVQTGGFSDKTIAERMTYAVGNEQEHASSLRQRIVDLNHTSFPLAFLFQGAGGLFGGISRCLPKALALKVDVAVEKRAVKDYGYFVRTLKLDDQTRQLLTRIIADEELHIRNWEDSVKIVQGKASAASS